MTTTEQHHAGHELHNVQARLAAIEEHGHPTTTHETRELRAIETELQGKLRAAKAQEARCSHHTDLASSCRERGTIILVTTAHPSMHQHTLAGELHPNLGRLIQPRHTSSIEATAGAGIPWAADNDCFQGLTEDRFVKMLDRIEGLPGCLFVTVPDVVEDAEATMELFEKWAPELEARGLPLGFVAQDGMENLEVPWDRIEALFIGGSTEWKLSDEAAELAREAKARGVWVHWGRVNSRRRFDHIVATGTADSFDGSKWARFRKTYLDQGLTWCLDTKPSSAVPALA